MADPLVVDVADLQLFMGVELDEERAQLMLDAVLALCEEIVTPLTASAKAVVLSAASRAYANPPGGVTSELVGPYQATRPLAGIYLTKGERASLRRSSGGGGAFSIDPTPADAGPYNSWAQVRYSPLDGPDASDPFDTVSEF